MQSVTRLLGSTIVRAFVIVTIALCIFSFSSYRAHAAALTESQIQAILGLLVSFGADQSVISNTELSLRGGSGTTPTPVATTTAQGTLSVSVDASSPAYQIVSGGAQGVTLGVFKFRASGEDVRLTKIGLTLTSGKSSDVSHVSLFTRYGELLGTAVFIGNSSSAVSSLSSSVQVAKDTDSIVIVKADLTSVGTGQPGTPGALIQIRPNPDTMGTGVSSGKAVYSNATNLDTAGVRVFKSYPTFAKDALPSEGLADGRLMRFKVTAAPSGSVGISNFGLRVASTGVGVSSVTVAVFSDAAYTMPVYEAGSGGYREDSGTRYDIQFNPGGLQIPAGQTRYFEVRSVITSLSTGSGTTLTTLIPDTTTFAGMSSRLGLFAGNYFIWSPNTLTTSTFEANDWTNGYGVVGLNSSLSQTRTGAGVKNPPTVTIDAASLASKTSTPTITGTAKNVSTTNFGLSIDNGDREFGSGHIAVVDGKWSVKVTTPLSDGTHNVRIYSDNVEINKSTLSITTVTSPKDPNDWVGGCANPPVYTGPDGKVGVAYRYDPGVYNAGAPYPQLPSGLTKSNGIIEGTPKVAGAVSVKVFATNSCGAILIKFNIVSSTTVTPVPVISKFAASPASVSEGGKTTLSWSVTNAQRCVLQSEGVEIAGLKPEGTQEVMPSLPSSTYLLWCANDNGTGKDGPNAQKSLIVKVSAAPAPTISAFTVSPAAVTAGASAKLSWAVKNASVCSLASNPSGVMDGKQSPSGDITVTPSVQTEYTLTCVSDAASQAGKTAQKTVTLTVNAPSTITTDKPVYAPGEAVRVSWNVTASVSTKDWVAIVTKGGAWGSAGKATTLWAYTNSGKVGSKTLMAPAKAGSYEAVYFASGSNAVRARQEFTVQEQSANLEPIGSGDYVSMAASAAMAPFGLMVEALTDLFIYAGIAQP
jgi:hypothetical protein